MKDYYFIYVTFNQVNGKQYCGQHCTFEINDGYLGSSKYLKDDIALYGKDKFSRKIIEYCEDIYDLAKRELYWILELNAVEDEMWYNVDYKCSPNVFFNKTHSDKTLKKLSKAAKGRFKSFSKKKQKKIGKKISKALKAYAQLVSSADSGAVRII